MIVGLTGLMASGKGEAVRILKEQGFKHITLSDMLRKEARSHGIEESRENLQDLGDKMRKEHGAGVLAMKARENINESENWVIDGIRNPAEILELRKSKNVIIIGIHADREALIQRILTRSREGDKKNREEIEALLNKEIGIGQPEDGQQVGKCMHMVDHLIVNEGSLEEFQERLLAPIHA